MCAEPQRIPQVWREGGHTRRVEPRLKVEPSRGMLKFLKLWKIGEKKSEKILGNNTAVGKFLAVGLQK